MISFKERLQKLEEQERINKIKLEENKWYEGKVTSAGMSESKNKLQQVTIKIELTQEDVKGKSITRNFVIDEKNPNEMQANIALSELNKLMSAFSLNFEDEEQLVVNLLKLKEQKVFIRVKFNHDKKDPSIVYSNYIVVKEPYEIR